MIHYVLEIFLILNSPNHESSDQQASGNKGRWDHVSSKRELVAKLLSSNKQTTQFSVRIRIAKNTTFLIDRKVSEGSLTPRLFSLFFYGLLNVSTATVASNNISWRENQGALRYRQK